MIENTLGVIGSMIFFIIIIALCCGGDSTSSSNTSPKKSTTTHHAPNSYSECPSCGAPYFDGYCDECGYPDINQGWIGENY